MELASLNTSIADHDRKREIENFLTNSNDLLELRLIKARCFLKDNEQIEATSSRIPVSYDNEIGRPLFGKWIFIVTLKTYRESYMLT
jgi:hypothetical protein